jgi:hypothetical protein
MELLNTEESDATRGNVAQNGGTFYNYALIL